MNKQNIIESACRFVRESKGNYIAEDIAISPDLVGMKIYEDPTFAFASATDDGFSKLKDPVAIGEHFKLPEEWLPEAKTVISFFLPFSDVIKESNMIDLSWPSDEWLHGRIEGQTFLMQLANETLEKHAPRYGCGKCQVGVPCESGIPIRRLSER